MSADDQPMFRTPKMDYALRGPKGEKERYHVKIIRRDGAGQTPDDYHATVTRLSDGTELVFINATKWILKLRTCRWLLDREFKYHDKRQVKLDEIEEFTR